MRHAVGIDGKRNGDDDDGRRRFIVSGGFSLTAQGLQKRFERARRGSREEIGRRLVVNLALEVLGDESRLDGLSIGRGLGCYQLEPAEGQESREPGCC